MPGFLRQSTAATIPIGPFVSPADTITPFTTGGWTVSLAANGGALAPRNEVTTVAYDANGFFSVALNATDTGTAGQLKVSVPGLASNYLPVWDDFTVLPQATYDAWFGAGEPGSELAQGATVTTLVLQAGTTFNSFPAPPAEAWITITNGPGVGTSAQVLGLSAGIIAVAGWPLGTPTNASYYSITGTPDGRFLLAPKGLDAVAVETGVNARQALSAVLAASAGAVTIGGNTVTIAAAGFPSTPRITGTTDESGQRSAITLILPS